MKLDRKLSEVLPQERERFLTLKYRELRLVQQVTSITHTVEGQGKDGTGGHSESPRGAKVRQVTGSRDQTK